jgi:hypothetical protein
MLMVGLLEVAAVERNCRRARKDLGDDRGEEDGEDALVVVGVEIASLSALAAVDVVDGAGGAAAAGGESSMPKGVSSSFTLEEDATLGVAKRCAHGDCALARAQSLR